MRRTPALIAAAATAALALAGCGSLGSAATGAQPSAPCTTKACIASDAQQSLSGLVAKDESVITGAKCRPSTVKHNAGNTWTVSCTATYSDGAKWKGLATLLPAQGKIAWEPTGAA